MPATAIGSPFLLAAVVMDYYNAFPPVNHFIPDGVIARLTRRFPSLFSVSMSAPDAPPAGIQRMHAEASRHAERGLKRCYIRSKGWRKKREEQDHGGKMFDN
jgi:hypothetical protein